MSGNLSVCQKGLKSQVAYSRKLARLREGQALLLEQRQCKFPLQLRFTDVSCREYFVWGRNRHVCSLYCQ